MTVEIFALVVLTLAILFLIALVIKLSRSIESLKTIIEITLTKYISMVRTLGVAEGNKEGVALQVAAQVEIDKECEAQVLEAEVTDTVTHEVTGIVKGIVKKPKENKTEG